MRAFVTGGTGFIGSQLVLALLARGWEVVCADINCGSVSRSGVRCLSVDLRRPETLEFDTPTVGPVDAVFHLGAVLPTHTPAPDTATYFTANAGATARLLELAERWDARTFAYASSLAVIGKPQHLPVREDHPTRPLHAYGLSKLCGELVCDLAARTGRCRVSALRISAPYGPGMAPDSVLPRFVRQARASEDLVWHGTGQRTQNFVHVSDVVRAFLLAAERATAGVCNVAGPVSISMRALAELVPRLVAGSRSRARPSGTTDPQDDYRWEVDLTRAGAELGYRPEVTLEQGLRDYVNFVASGAPAPTWVTPP